MFAKENEKQRIKFMHSYCKIAEEIVESSEEVPLVSSSDISIGLADDQVKYLLENCSEPIVLKNLLKWRILKWELDDWCAMLENEELLCRCGRNAHSKNPQWETVTPLKTLKISNFVELRDLNFPEEWIYFDYKYLKDWNLEKEKFKREISWKDFGYPDIGYKDSTIWIGTKGAHTPCHSDTYGFNLVAQVLGRKLWLLFPPSENLKPTRVPYEESSVFSQLNFFSPDLRKFRGIKNCRKVILNPGEVLFVPHGWWHYVENLELSISINTWLPAIQDKEKRLEESIVKTIVSQFAQNLTEEERNLIIIKDKNNSSSTFQSLHDQLNINQFCLKSCQNFSEPSKTTVPEEPCSSSSVSKLYSVDYLLQTFPVIFKTVPVLTQVEFSRFLSEQRKRFQNNKQDTTENGTEDDFHDMVCNFLTAILKPNVINVIKDNLL